GGWDVYPVNRGNWVDVTQDPTTGQFNVSNPYVRRTPWYMQSDLNLMQNYKVGERYGLSFSATFTNLFNQRSVTAFNEQIDSGAIQSFTSPAGTSCAGTSSSGVLTATGYPCYIASGVQWYAASMTPCGTAGPAGNLKNNLNYSLAMGSPVLLSSQYGQPMYYQISRNIRLAVKFTF